MKKTLKITLIVLGSLVALLFIATLLVSPIATSYVNKNGKDLIGRTIQVDDISLNIYTGHLQVVNLRILEDDDSTTFLSFDTLDTKAKLFRLLSSEVYLEHIDLAGLDVNILQHGDDFNFYSIIDFFDSDEDTTDEDTTASDWKICLYNIDLSRGHIYYADQDLNTDWDLKNINIKVPGFIIGGDESTDAGLTLQLADGGTLNTDINYDINTNDFTAKVNLDDFALSNIKAYLTDVVRLSAIKGSLDAHIEASGNLDRIEQLSIKGNASCSNLDILTLDNQSILSLRKLDIDIADIQLDKEYYDIQSLTIDGLASRYDLYHNDDNFSRFLVSDESTEANPESEPTADSATSEPVEMQVFLRHFHLSNSSFTYADHTLPDPFVFPLTKIDIQANDLTLSGNNSANIKASLPNGGTANIDWRGNIDDFYANQSLKLDINNLRMADISPYTVAYLGWPFEDGTFSFRSQNTIRNSMLDGQNHLDLFKATVGKKRKDVDAEINIPLKAALYVLKDKDDKIIFDIPISGNVESPDFNYMKLVWKTLGNLLVKVATQPFRLAGNALGIGGDNDQFVPIDTAQTLLTSEQFHEFERYADVLKQVPDLHINLQQQLDASSDSAALQRAEQRNVQVVDYFIKQMNLSPKQISTEISLIEKLKKPGFFINGKIEDSNE